MATRRKQPPSRLWQVSIIRRKGETLGLVEAPDAAAAIQAAIQKYQIRDRERQRRLAAVPVAS